MRPSAAQRRWLARGLDQPGGKLPLFDENGQTVNPQTIRSCIRQGWAAPWIRNPIKPDWLVCKLTDAGRAVLAEDGGGRREAERAAREDVGGGSIGSASAARRPEGRRGID